MSRRRRPRTSRQFSQPSSTTSSAAVSSAPPEESDVIIRFAAGDDDCIAIHRFLLVVYQGQTPAPVDHMRSILEVIRVVNHEAALMAIKDGMLIGTMGIIAPEWWYAKEGTRFMTNRWWAVLPQYRNGPVNDALIEEAGKVAQAAGLQLILHGKTRERVKGDRPVIYQPLTTRT